MSILALFQARGPIGRSRYEVWTWSKFKGMEVRQGGFGDEREARRAARREGGRVVDRTRADRTIFESSRYRRVTRKGGGGGGGGGGSPYGSGHKTWAPSLTKLQTRELEAGDELDDDDEDWLDEW